MLFFTRKHLKLRLANTIIINLRKGFVSQAEEMATKRKKFVDPKLVPHAVAIEVLSNGSTHMAPSIILRTPTHSYMFNCPEGMSRFSMAMRLRANKINDVFITRDVWENVGGMFGLIMGKAEEVADTDFRIHAPPAVNRFLEVLRPMADEAGERFPVRVKECNNMGGHHDDSTLHVDYLQVLNKKEGRYTVHTDEKSTTENVAYLIELKKRPPPIDINKVVQLKLPLKIVGDLKAGMAVTLEDGRVISPEDVIDREKTEQEFPNLLVVDIMSKENLESISTNPCLMDYYASNRTKQMNYIIHFAPSHIFGLYEYREWLQEFGPKCTHLVLNGEGKPVPQMNQIYNSQNMLREIFPEGFPDLYPNSQHYEGKQFTQDSTELDVCIHEGDDHTGPIILPASRRRFLMRGMFSNNKEEQIKLQFTSGKESIEERAQLREDLPKEIAEFRRATSTVLERLNRDGPTSPYPIVTFFGTCSAIPSVYRNVTAHMLQTNEDSNFLIDCGESTYGQMKAMFGPEETDKLLVNLHAIFITHNHADHILGIFNIVQKRIDAFKRLETPFRPLLLVSDHVFVQMCEQFCKNFFDLRPYVFMLNWVSNVQQKYNEEIITNRRGCANLEEDFKCIRGDKFSLDKWNLRSIRTPQVIHKKWSCGYIFVTERENLKIVFSGDTTPSDNLELHGADADLLIHECTFEDGMEKDARYKKHSTMQQAFDSAKRMGAKNVIFTHFSARYNHVPPLPDYLLEAGTFSCAMDNMVVPFHLLPLFHKLLPVYRQLYRNELLEMDVKITSRNFMEKMNPNEEREDDGKMRQKRRYKS